ncbi:GUN4 domain-containing protein [Cylindrospermopsis raciborskii]|jgi:hypothetical protein|uniref:GUN4 domain-containing protein n=1 Tax=Cylindrospermopsis raciborskii TaxID=77022 RepID=UPI001F1C3018|nr:GUN4 domain-containing protein [Cylindrospermopsis raciborskii]UJS06233.1 GUN4 domain-containing protein [Cylindrospermopsis raciborskii KLL07]
MSESNSKYKRLENLLKPKRFREADEETAKIMVEIANKQSDGWLRAEDAEKFPHQELLTIDDLWLRYSQGKFGISIQQQIYKNLGGTKEYSPSIWISFGDRTGWRHNGYWLSYNSIMSLYYDDLWSLYAPKGQLPLLGGWEQWGCEVGMFFPPLHSLPSLTSLE